MIDDFPGPTANDQPLPFPETKESAPKKKRGRPKASKVTETPLKEVKVVLTTEQANELMESDVDIDPFTDEIKNLLIKTTLNYPQLEYDYNDEKHVLTLKGGVLVHRGYNLCGISKNAILREIGNYCRQSFPTFAAAEPVKQTYG
jgi:hypothetical protein